MNIKERFKWFRIYLNLKWDWYKRYNPLIHKIIMRSHMKRWEEAKSYDGDDEFHPSLDQDIRFLMDANDDERDAYMQDLMKRRVEQHQKDFN